MKEWLQQPIDQIPAERNEILLKLFFGRHQKHDNIQVYLKDYYLKLKKQYETYEQIEQMISKKESVRGRPAILAIYSRLWKTGNKSCDGLV